jgi:hypothetical protein
MALSVFGYSLFDIGYLILVIRHWLFDIGYSTFSGSLPHSAPIILPSIIAASLLFGEYKKHVRNSSGLRTLFLYIFVTLCERAFNMRYFRQNHGELFFIRFLKMI